MSFSSESSSSSSFLDPGTFNANWSDITQLSTRSRNVLYVATRYGRRFLLKALLPEHRELTDYRLLHEKEFRLGVSLNHPNIAATYAYEDITGLGPCIVQEYIDGEPLSAWLDKKPAAEARQRVLQQLLDALEYLHSRQFVHNDIKSGNILVTRNGSNLKLIDFGLSDTDDSTTPRDNDLRNDIRKLEPLLGRMFPNRYFFVKRGCRLGKYSNIATLRKALGIRKTLLRAIPYAVLMIALAAAAVLLYISREKLETANRQLDDMAHEMEYTQQSMTEQLEQSRKELEEAKAAMSIGVDTLSIRTAIKELYRPLYDSMKTTDGHWREIAYARRIPLLSKQAQLRDELCKDMKKGTIEYTLFIDTWLFILNEEGDKYNAVAEKLPPFGIATGDGTITADEAQRLAALQKSILKANIKADK